MNRIYEQLMRIKKNPYIFLGAPSLDALRHFMTGYSLRDDEATQGKHADWYNNFHVFTYQFFDVDYFATSKSWVDVLRENSQSEEEAFSKFFEVLDCYQRTLENE